MVSTSNRTGIRWPVSRRARTCNGDARRASAVAEAMEPLQQQLRGRATLRVGQKPEQQLMIGGAPVGWITKIYLPPSLLLRPMCARSSRAHGRSAWVPAWGTSLSRKTLLGWKPLRLAPRCALLLMVMNIQPPLSSTRTRRLAAPLTTVQWASTAIIAAEPGAARCSRRRASTRRGRDRTLPVEWSPEHQIGVSVYRQPFATNAQ